MRVVVLNVCELIARPVCLLQMRDYDCTALPGRTAISISIRTVGRNKRSAFRRKNNGTTAIPRF